MHTQESALRRLSRVALAAGLVAALGATGSVPAFAQPDTPASTPGPVKDADDKLGSLDAELLAKAKAKGDKHITMMIATRPGGTETVREGLEKSGASVGRSYDKLGYVRATVPTRKADAAIAKAQKSSAVQGIDLRQEVKLPDPTPRADRAKGATRAGDGTYPAPDQETPARNPYQPSFETGAVDFVENHPKADGRGVTIGILDSGVDLAHPALQKTTTGERKITDWVTATDPIVDQDATWRPMVTEVSGASFSFAGRTYTAPEGSYQISVFRESTTRTGDMAGDLNRDGDTTDSWALLYDAAAGTVRVDLDDDADFGDESAMKPYREDHQVGYFGTDDPKTTLAEAIPFVVQIRKDVPMDPYGGDWVGKKVDFVNIGIVESSHGSHVAGITAANKLFGGKMNGAAPGAKLVSSRACTWDGECTNVALTEGMIDLVVNRGVDIVNVSIGGLPALNDGNDARAELYGRLIDRYGVQLVISAGNSGPGANTIGDPGLADKVISVGASVSKETWAANYGSAVKKRYDMFPFSSRGPREDGGFTPTLAAPGASVNTIPTWQTGSPVAEAGYELPPGYGMFQGTSMASPQAAGASALLLSAAKQKEMKLTPAQLRTALTSTTRTIPDSQAYAQGAGLINVEKAWDLLKKGVSSHTYSVQAPVNTALSGLLKTPHTGTGVYDREGGLKPGKAKAYTITLTRTSGPDHPVRHSLRWENNDGSFRIAGPSGVTLPLNAPVKVKVTAKAGHGIHSAILTVDDHATTGIDHRVLTTVVVADKLTGPDFTLTKQGTVRRNGSHSHFITVPKDTKAFEVTLGELAKGSQTRWVAINPYGVPADSTNSPLCYANYDNPANTCRPDLRSYQNPLPGVWELEVESRRTSSKLANPYQLGTSALGISFDPPIHNIEEAKRGTPTPLSWKVTNHFAPIKGTSRGGELGSAASGRPSIGEGESKETTLEIGSGVSRLDVAIGQTSDAGADLDLFVLRDGQVVAQSTEGDSDETVSIAKPDAGAYTIVVKGYSVPTGTTAYDYRDVYFSAELGSVKVDESKEHTLGNGVSADIPAEVLVTGQAPEGRRFFGEVEFLNARGTVTGSGSVMIAKVTDQG